jgi:ABC-2 type transport system permease protein/oleandomycin transport system permease protein
MSSTTTEPARSDATAHVAAPAVDRPHFVGDALVIAWRNLLNIRRNPQLLVFSIVQPLVLVLMFRYVFGGAIDPASLRGVSYVNFLMPGIFVLTVVFGAMTTAVGMATDVHLGLIERLKSLPIARSAVLTGRTTADLVRSLFVIVLMCAVGFALGWEVVAGWLPLLAAILLILGFSYSLSWIFAYVGMSVRDAETAQAASLPVLAVLVFASSAFIPVSTMPDWLRPLAEHQPVSAVCTASRALTLGLPAADDVLEAVAWIVGIVAVFAPLAIHRYRKVA